MKTMIRWYAIAFVSTAALLLGSQNVYAQGCGAAGNVAAAANVRGGNLQSLQRFNSGQSGMLQAMQMMQQAQRMQQQMMQARQMAPLRQPPIRQPQGLSNGRMFQNNPEGRNNFMPFNARMGNNTFTNNIKPDGKAKPTRLTYAERLQKRREAGKKKKAERLAKRQAAKEKRLAKLQKLKEKKEEVE